MLESQGFGHSRDYAVRPEHWNGHWALNFGWRKPEQATALCAKRTKFGFFRETLSQPSVKLGNFRRNLQRAAGTEVTGG